MKDLETALDKVIEDYIAAEKRIRAYHPNVKETDTGIETANEVFRSYDLDPEDVIQHIRSVSEDLLDEMLEVTKDTKIGDGQTTPLVLAELSSALMSVLLIGVRLGMEPSNE